MEQARSLHDCYFYYYSTCRKGNTCTFRHFEGALGHEEACKLFLEGKCYNPMCTMRHMKIQKPRKDTPCYWEQQPSGCRKPHCVFQHRNPRNQTMNQAIPMPPANGAMIQMPQAGTAGLILVPRIL